jgi:glutamate synthase (NADPH/NADH) small chain
LVVGALGFVGAVALLLVHLDVALVGVCIAMDVFGMFATFVPGVFAVGVGRGVQSLVVWAFIEGRGAARECDRYLMGGTDLP